MKTTSTTGTSGSAIPDGSMTGMIACSGLFSFAVAFLFTTVRSTGSLRQNVRCPPESGKFSANMESHRRAAVKRHQIHRWCRQTHGQEDRFTAVIASQIRDGKVGRLGDVSRRPESVLLSRPNPDLPRFGSRRSPIWKPCHYSGANCIYREWRYPFGFKGDRTDLAIREQEGRTGPAILLQSTDSHCEVWRADAPVVFGREFRIAMFKSRASG
jgi:hypothetical protein